MDTEYYKGTINEEWHEIEHFSPEDAAEEYADFVFSNRDGWEYGHYWTDDFSVVVMDENKKLHYFNINVESEPIFRSEVIKDEKNK